MRHQFMRVAGNVAIQPSLLLHMNGNEGSTTFADTSGHNISVTGFGDAKVTNANPKFGNGALKLTNGGYLMSAASSLLQLGSVNFTVECWVYLQDGSNANNGLFSFGSNAQNTGDLFVSTYGGSWYIGAEGGGGDAAGTSIVGSWQHVAVARSGGAIRLYINGILGKSISSISLSSNFVGIGYYYAPQYSLRNALIDDFRVIKGTALYTANFTPPTAPFPDF